MILNFLSTFSLPLRYLLSISLHLMAFFCFLSYTTLFLGPCMIAFLRCHLGLTYVSNFFLLFGVDIVVALLATDERMGADKKRTKSSLSAPLFRLIVQY